MAKMNQMFNDQTFDKIISFKIMSPIISINAVLSDVMAQTGNLLTVAFTIVRLPNAIFNSLIQATGFDGMYL